MEPSSALIFNLVLDNPDEINREPVLDDDDTDLVIKTSDGTLRTHKSVVQSCAYFAAMINGNWLESQTSVINLDGYSSKTVRFILEHLYKPKNEITGDQSLDELLALVDMLGVQSLFELVCLSITTQVCHNFHKPCKDCIEGVTRSLQLASAYGIKDVHDKCLKWLTKHVVKTWNSRHFASLPEPLQTSCLKSLENQMRVHTIIDMSLDCQKLQETLPSVKWAEPVKALAQQLSASCTAFIQLHFQDIILSARFKSFGQGDTWSVSQVETVFLEAVQNLPVEQACLSYTALEAILQKAVDLDDEQRPDLVYISFIKALYKAVETRLVQRVGIATKCLAWNVLPKTKQTSIMQMGFFDPIDSNLNKPLLKPKVGKANPLRRNISLNASSGDSPASSTNGPVLQREPLRQTIHGRASSRLTGPSTMTNSRALPPLSGNVSLQAASARTPTLERSLSARTAGPAVSRPTTHRPIASDSSRRCTISRTPVAR